MAVYSNKMRGKIPFAQLYMCKKKVCILTPGAYLGFYCLWAISFLATPSLVNLLPAQLKLISASNLEIYWHRQSSWNHLINTPVNSASTWSSLI